MATSDGAVALDTPLVSTAAVLSTASYCPKTSLARLENNEPRPRKDTTRRRIFDGQDGTRYKVVACAPEYGVSPRLGDGLPCHDASPPHCQSQQRLKGDLQGTVSTFMEMAFLTGLIENASSFFLVRQTPVVPALWRCEAPTNRHLSASRSVDMPRL